MCFENIEKQSSEKDDIIDTLCPICGKNFIPAPLHIYKTYGGRRVCSYHCKLEGERTFYRPTKGKYLLKSVLLLDHNGNVKQEFDCAKDASEVLHIAAEAIRKCCRGESSNAGGLVFRYKNQ